MGALKFMNIPATNGAATDGAARPDQEKPTEA
jgi:hypothetical protein